MTYSGFVRLPCTWHIVRVIAVRARSAAGGRAGLAVVGALTLLVFAGCGEDRVSGAVPVSESADQVATAAVAAGSASQGRTVFETTCIVCHKLGEAEVGAGPRLVGANLTVEAIKGQVQHPRDAMPPNLVSGTDLDDVAAFIMQLQ